MDSTRLQFALSEVEGSESDAVGVALRRHAKTT